MRYGLKMGEKICLYCKEPLGINYPYYLIKKAIRPKGHQHRWKRVASACESCIEGKKKPTHYEQGEELPK